MALTVNAVERFFFPRKGESMTTSKNKTMTGKIFDNILFLAEVFGDLDDKDIPKTPVLEMAQCFDLTVPRSARVMPPRSNSWALWK